MKALAINAVDEAEKELHKNREEKKLALKLIMLICLFTTTW